MVDDGTCIQGGCTDSRFDEFNPSATWDDGTCPPVLVGCMDTAAVNYRSAATIQGAAATLEYDNPGCIYQGCMDTLALNYDPSATLAGPCVGAVAGCTDAAALNYYAGANMPVPDSVRSIAQHGSASPPSSGPPQAPEEAKGRPKARPASVDQ